MTCIFFIFFFHNHSSFGGVICRVSVLLSCGKGIYGFLTGSKGQALRVFKKIFLFPAIC